MLFFVVILTNVLPVISSAETRVLTLAGSTREGSTNKKLARLAANYATQLGANAIYIDIRDYPIPFYDEDLESSQGMPDNAKAIRQMMIESQIIFIASPNYNRSPSAVLKNLLDWVSRGETGGESFDAFKDKKFVLMSASPGATGGIKGLPHLRDIIGVMDGTVSPKEFAVPKAYEAFDEQGQLVDPKKNMELLELVREALN